MIGTAWHVVTEPGDHSLDVPTSPPPVHGTKVIRFELRAGETMCGLDHPKFTGYPEVPGGVEGGNGPFAISDEVPFGIAYFVPTSDPNNADELLVLAVKDTPDTADLNDQREPWLELAIVAGQWRIRSRTDTDETGSPTMTTHYTANLVRGRWTYWIFEVTWDHTGGVLNVWRAEDNEGEVSYTQVVTATPNIGYNQLYPGYVWMGLECPGNSATRVISADILKIGKPEAGMAGVDPSGTIIPTPGPGPTDPPDPIPGDPLFGIFDLPLTGSGVWNATVKPCRANNVVSIINTARASGIRLLLQVYGPAGSSADSISPGRQYIHQRVLDRIAEYSGATLTAVLNALADGTVVGFYAFDEPLMSSRYGRVVTWNEISEICLALKAKFGSDVRTYLRIAGPTSVGQHVNGLTHIWMTYRESRGALATYIARETAEAVRINHYVAPSMNLLHMVGSGSADDDNEAFWVTPTKFREVAYAMAEINPLLVDPVAAAGRVFISWEFNQALFSKPGMAQAVLDGATRWQSRMA